MNYDLVEKFDMHHHTEAIGRVYALPNGERYPSITTILGKQPKDGLDAWRERVGESEANRIMKKSAAVGNELHEHCEDFVMGRTPEPMDAGMHLLFGGIKRHLKRIDNVRGVEIPMWSHHLKLAGRSDCIAEYDGVPSIIDYKNSRSEKPHEWCTDYFLQGAAYSRMFHEVYGGKPIGQTVIIIAQWGRPVKVYKERVRDWIKPLDKVMAQYNPLWR